MDFSSKSGATLILAVLTVAFFGVSVWVHVALPTDTAFATQLWDVFFMCFGGLFVILKSDAGFPPEQTSKTNPPATPEQE